MEVKPWEAETDMEEMEQKVRSIEQDGLVWGASKLVAIGYGVKKLQITLVVGKHTGRRRGGPQAKRLLCRG